MHKTDKMQSILSPQQQAVEDRQKDQQFDRLDIRDTLSKLEKLEAKKCDINLPIQDMEMTSMGDVVISVPGAGGQEDSHLMLTPNFHAHGQIANKLGIDTRYWRKMVATLPELAAENFNAWIRYEVEKKGADKSRRMFARAYYDGQVGDTTGIMRGLLSDQYMVVDNLQVLSLAVQSATKFMDKTGVKVKVRSCSLTDKNFYAYFTCPSLREEAKGLLRNYRDPNGGEFGGIGRDNGLVTGFGVRNSEVCAGKLEVFPFVSYDACANLMMFRDEAMSRTHLGGKMDEGFFSDRTRRKNQELVESQMRDALDKFLHPDFMGQRVADLEKMAQRKISNPTFVVRNVGYECGMTEVEREKAVEMFLRGGSHENMHDVAQAITATAHHASADRRFELSSMAAGILKFADRCDVDRDLTKRK